MYNKILTILFVLFTCVINTNGQSLAPSILNATGGTVVIGSNTFDYSIGEMTVVSTIYATSLTITQGVLQPINGGVTGLARTNLTQNLIVFPNPARSIINVRFTSAQQGMFSYRLMDMAGNMIMNHNAEIQQGLTLEQLNIDKLAAATYMLEISFKAEGFAEGTISYKIEKVK